MVGIISPLVEIGLTDQILGGLKPPQPPPPGENPVSGDFVLISADVILKMIIILNELRIAQLCCKNGWTLILK